MVKTITMTALLFLSGVGAVLWLLPHEWMGAALASVTLALCAVYAGIFLFLHQLFVAAVSLCERLLFLCQRLSHIGIQNLQMSAL